MDWFTDIFPLGAAALLLFACALAIQGLRDLPQLPQAAKLRQEKAPNQLNQLRIVVASRNGGAEILETVRRLLSSSLQSIELVVVDDRSDDGSSDELEDRFGDDPRFRVLRINSLPEGWLGKPHACMRGDEGFDGDFLLFLDADTWFEDGALESLLAEAEATGADHFCVLPALRDTTAGGRALCCAMALGLLIRVRGLERDRNPRGFGVGACTLIRTSLYEQIGGHEAQRLQVVEDVAIARRAIGTGARSRLRFGTGLVTVRWITSLPSAFAILEKNWFGAFGFRWHLLLPATAIALSVQCFVVLGLFSAQLLTILASATAILAFATVCTLQARRYRWPFWTGLLAPLLWGLVPITMLWSAFRTQARGGVRWRDTFTPLEQLRSAGPP